MERQRNPGTALPRGEANPHCAALHAGYENGRDKELGAKVNRVEARLARGGRGRAETMKIMDQQCWRHPQAPSRTLPTLQAVFEQDPILRDAAFGGSSG